MKKKWLIIAVVALIASHGAALFAGFSLGVYYLPILIEPAGPSAGEIAKMAADVRYSGTFTDDQPGNDFVHWARGELFITDNSALFEGEIAPGPDYRLYLVPEYVRDEAEFLAVKDRSVVLGDVRTFSRFALDLPAGVDIEDYEAALIWCESFGEFISVARLRGE